MKISPLNRFRVVTVSSLVAALLASGSLADAAAQPRRNRRRPQPGTLEVIAQGVVAFDGSAYRWKLGSHAVPADGQRVHRRWRHVPRVHDRTRPSRCTATRARGPGSPPGEATFRFSGSTAATSAGAAATLTTISVDLAADGGADAFTPGAGTHDMDLLRDVLAAGETFTLTSELPAFVLVTSGTVTDGTGPR